MIQPILGPNIYWEHLEAERDGPAHIKDVMPDGEIPRMLAEPESNGYSVTQTGWIDGTIPYYLNIQDDLGLVY